MIYTSPPIRFQDLVVETQNEIIHTIAQGISPKAVKELSNGERQVIFSRAREIAQTHVNAAAVIDLRRYKIDSDGFTEEEKEDLRLDHVKGDVE